MGIERCFFFREGLQYRDVEYNTASIVLLSISQIRDVLYVSDSDRYIEKKKSQRLSQYDR